MTRCQVWDEVSGGDADGKSPTVSSRADGHMTNSEEVPTLSLEHFSQTCCQNRLPWQHSYIRQSVRVSLRMCNLVESFKARRVILLQKWSFLRQFSDFLATPTRNVGPLCWIHITLQQQRLIWSEIISRTMKYLHGSKGKHYQTLV